jgi:homeobox protein cut-like
MEEMIQEKILQKENELNATYDERLRNYEERYDIHSLYPDIAFNLNYREQDLRRQISLTKNQLRDLRMSNESNQAKLLDHSQRQGTPPPFFRVVAILMEWMGRPRSSSETH